MLQPLSPPDILLAKELAQTNQVSGLPHGQGLISRRERLGGLLKSYQRDAA